MDALVEKAKRLRLGDPYREDVDLGPIVNEKQLARVDGIVRRSVDGGARLAVGGTHDGLFYRPTVLADVSRDLPAWTDEIFGPVAPVVAFDTDDEALALANDTEYGLAGAVYSRSISRGLAFAQRIRAGMVHVNDQTVNDEAVIPFGGMGASGNGGRFGGAANWDAFTQWQWVSFLKCRPLELITQRSLPAKALQTKAIFLPLRDQTGSWKDSHLPLRDALFVIQRVWWPEIVLVKSSELAGK